MTEGAVKNSRGLAVGWASTFSSTGLLEKQVRAKDRNDKLSTKYGREPAKAESEMGSLI